MRFGTRTSASAKPATQHGAASVGLGAQGDVAEWLRSGLQSRLHRFDSGRRLSNGSRRQLRNCGCAPQLRQADRARSSHLGAARPRHTAGNRAVGVLDCLPGERHRRRSCRSKSHLPAALRPIRTVQVHRQGVVYGQAGVGVAAGGLDCSCRSRRRRPLGSGPLDSR